MQHIQTGEAISAAHREIGSGVLGHLIGLYRNHRSNYLISINLHCQPTGRRPGNINNNIT